MLSSNWIIYAGPLPKYDNLYTQPIFAQLYIYISREKPFFVVEKFRLTFN